MQPPLRLHQPRPLRRRLRPTLATLQAQVQEQPRVKTLAQPQLSPPSPQEPQRLHPSQTLQQAQPLRQALAPLPPPLCQTPLPSQPRPLPLPSQSPSVAPAHRTPQLCLMPLLPQPAATGPPLFPRRVQAASHLQQHQQRFPTSLNRSQRQPPRRTPQPSLIPRTLLLEPQRPQLQPLPQPRLPPALKLHL